MVDVILKWTRSVFGVVERTCVAEYAGDASLYLRESRLLGSGCDAVICSRELGQKVDMNGPKGYQCLVCDDITDHLALYVNDLASSLLLSNADLKALQRAPSVTAPGSFAWLTLEIVSA
jgi:hypothetical protein